MPLYEYACLDCHTLFDALRSMSDADTPIACEACGGERTERMISVFFSHSEGKSLAGSGGCACASGGACGCAN